MQHLKKNIQSSIKAILIEGSFARNFAITFSGTAFVTILGFLLSPIISRLYTPEAYGLFAVVSSILNNVNVFSTLLYTTAFVRPKKHEDFMSLVQLTLFLTIVSFVLISIITVLLGEQILVWLHAEKLNSVLYLLPIILLMANLNNIMVNWFVRTKDFMKRTWINVVINLSAKFTTIGYGAMFTGTTVTGFVLSDLLSRILGNILFFKYGFLQEIKELYKTFSIRKIKQVAIVYKRYPLYIVPSTYINMFSGQLPIYMLANFGTTTVGWFAFSASMLEIPLTMLGNAMSPVFLQKAADTFRENPKDLGRLSYVIYFKLLYLGILPFSVLTIFGDWIFGFVFGDNWEMAGVYSGYLGFYYIFRLISYPISSVFSIIGREKYEFYSNIIILVLRGISLGIGVYLNDVKLAILLFSVTSMVFYFLLSQFIFILLGVSVTKIIIKTIVLVGASFVLMELLRTGIEKFIVGYFAI